MQKHFDFWSRYSAPTSALWWRQSIRPVKDPEVSTSGTALLTKPLLAVGAIATVRSGRQIRRIRSPVSAQECLYDCYPPLHCCWSARSVSALRRKQLPGPVRNQIAGLSLKKQENYETAMKRAVEDESMQIKPGKVTAVTQSASKAGRQAAQGRPEG